MKKRILYCICAMRQFLVVEDEILSTRMNFEIHANRVFGLNPVQPGLIARPGTMITFDVAEMVNVQMKCDFICDLQDTDPLYKKMIEEINKPKVVVGQFQGGDK